VKELNGCGAEHKMSFNGDGTLPFQYLLKDFDIKYPAIELGVSLFVVSTDALQSAVLQYLTTVSAENKLDSCNK
jgi:hypothetical protein